MYQTKYLYSVELNDNRKISGKNINKLFNKKEYLLFHRDVMYYDGKPIINDIKRIRYIDINPRSNDIKLIIYKHIVVNKKENKKELFNYLNDIYNVNVSFQNKKYHKHYLIIDEENFEKLYMYCLRSYTLNTYDFKIYSRKIYNYINLDKKEYLLKKYIIRKQDIKRLFLNYNMNIGINTKEISILKRKYLNSEIFKINNHIFNKISDLYYNKNIKYISDLLDISKVTVKKYLKNTNYFDNKTFRKRYNTYDFIINIIEEQIKKFGMFSKTKLISKLNKFLSKSMIYRYLRKDILKEFIIEFNNKYIIEPIKEVKEKVKEGVDDILNILNLDSFEVIKPIKPKKNQYAYSLDSYDDDFLDQFDW